MHIDYLLYVCLQLECLLCLDLQEMPLEDISALQEELELAIKEYSEVLLCQLVLREELVFQRELFNQFISLLLSIQKKRRTLDADRRKGRPATEPPAYKVSTFKLLWFVTVISPIQFTASHILSRIIVL